MYIYITLQKSVWLHHIQSWWFIWKSYVVSLTAVSQNLYYVNLASWFGKWVNVLHLPQVENKFTPPDGGERSSESGLKTCTRKYFFSQSWSFECGSVSSKLTRRFHIPSRAWTQEVRRKKKIIWNAKIRQRVEPVCTDEGNTAGGNTLKYYCVVLKEVWQN